MKQKKFIVFPLIALFILLALPKAVFSISEDDVKAALDSMNDQLALAGEDFQVEKVEFQTVDEVGIIVYANDRTHQLTSHWVPFDPRRYGVSEIYWTIDQVDQTFDVPWADVNSAIDRAMTTWNTVPCANIPLVKISDYGYDWGYVQFLVGYGGFPGWLADITHAGYLPGAFFDAIGGTGGATSILGATFTFVWNNPPDLDGNGKSDVAFKEIYYNDNFSWKIDQRLYDIESVVLHEVGHALSLGHFGMIFRSPGNGKLHFAPEAVMNAIYYTIRHELLGTDNGSFCSLWASWPNN